MKSIKIAIAALAGLMALSSCVQEAPEIHFSQQTTIESDFTGIIDALKDMNTSLADKLALIQGAIDNQKITLGQKMELLTEAVKNGFISQSQMAQKTIEAINAIKGSLDDKLNAIKTVIDDVNGTLVSKLDLINGAITTGLANNEAAIGLVQSVLNTMNGTLVDKLGAIDSAIQTSSNNLAGKLVLIEGAVRDGITSQEAAMKLISDALVALEGTTKDKLDAISGVITTLDGTLASNLDLIQKALNLQVAESKNLYGLIEKSVEKLNGTMESNMREITGVIAQLDSNLVVSLSLIQASVENGAITPEQFKEILTSVAESTNAVLDKKLEAIYTVLDGMDSNLQSQLTWIVSTVNTGFLSLDKSLGLIKDAIKDQPTIDKDMFSDIVKAIGSLEGKIEGKLEAIRAIIETMNGTLNSKLGFIQEAVEGGLTDVNTAVGLIKDAIKDMPAFDTTDLHAIAETLAAFKKSYDTEMKYVGELLGVINNNIYNGFGLVVSALETGLGDIKAACGLIKDAIEAQPTIDNQSIKDMAKALSEFKGSYDAQMKLVNAALEGISKKLGGTGNNIFTQLTFLATTVSEGITDLKDILNNLQQIGSQVTYDELYAAMWDENERYFSVQSMAVKIAIVDEAYAATSITYAQAETLLEYYATQVATVLPANRDFDTLIKPAVNNGITSGLITNLFVTKLKAAGVITAAQAIALTK